MSLLRRVQLVNFLNSTGGDQWSADFIDVIYKLHCFSSAIIMENGIGKTSLLDGVNALLSHDSTMIKATKLKMPPKSYGIPGHIRLEFLKKTTGGYQMTIDAPSGMAGETEVFGLYGFRDSTESGLNFYYYTGTLEDVPLSSKSKDRVKYKTLAEFKGLLNRKGGQRIDRVRQWNDQIGFHIPRQQALQILQFHKQGGSDKGGEIFPVNVREQDTYDKAFFYQIIAPYLLSGSLVETNDTNESLEHAVLSTASDIILNQEILENNKKKLQDSLDSLKDLKPLFGPIKRIQEAEKQSIELKGNLSRTLSEVDYITQANLPGVPNEILVDAPEIELLIRYMAIVPGQGVMLMDRGLAELLGKQAKHINQYAVQFGLDAIDTVQPIEIILDPANTIFKKRSFGGTANHFYILNAVINFIDKSTDDYLKNRNRNEIKDIITKAFGIAESADTNPCRQEVIKIQGRMVEVEEQHSGIIKQKKSATEEHGRQLKDLSELQVLKQSYERIDRKGIFSVLDLEGTKESPADCETRLVKDRDAISGEIVEVSRQIGLIDGAKKQLDDFFRKYGNQDPEVIFKELKSKQFEATGKEKDLATKINQITGALPDAKSAEKSTRDRKYSLSSILTNLEQWQKESNGLLEDFPGAETPQDIQQVITDKKQKIDAALDAVITVGGVINEFDTATREIERLTNERQLLEEKLSEYEVQYAFIQEFNAAFPGINPDQFLEDVQERIRDYKAHISSLESQKKDFEKALVQLEQKKVAATPEIQNAWEKHIPQSTPKLYEMIDQTAGEKKKELLEQFSALLFSPVVDEPAQARRLAGILDEQNVSLPVFSKNEFLKGVTIGSAGNILDSIVGFPTEVVEMILYPEKLEQKKEKVKEQIEDLHHSIGDHASKIDRLGDDQPNQVLARNASKAITLEVHLKRNNCIGSLETISNNISIKKEESGKLSFELNELWIPLASIHEDAHKLEPSPKNLGIIKNAIKEQRRDHDKKFGESSSFRRQFDGFKRFFEAGGEKGKATLERDLEAAKQDHRAAIQQHEGLQRELSDVQTSQIDVRKALLELDAELKSYHFEDMIALYKSDDLKRYDELKNKLVGLTDKQQELIDLLSLPFRDAHLFYTQRDRFESLKITAADLDGTLKDLRNEIDDIEAQLSEYDGRLRTVSRHAEDLDLLVYQLYKVFKERQSVTFTMDTSAIVCDEVEDSVRIIRDALNGANSQYPSLIKQVKFLKDRFTLAEIKQMMKGLSDLRDKTKEEMSRYCREIDRLHPRLQGTPSFVKNNIMATKSRPVDLIDIYQKIQKHIEERKQEESRILEAIDESRQKAEERLGAIGRFGRQQLTAFKNVCNKYKKQATFLITAKVAAADQIQEATRYIYDEITDRITAKYDTSRLEEEEVRREIQNDPGLIEEVKKNLYRSIFRTPSIEVKHPDIRGGNAVPYSNKKHSQNQVSNGQKTALDLMMLIRLSEYCSLNGEYTTNQSFFLVDGLFSNLSRESLINAPLSSLKEVKGAFQLIGFMHSLNYVNNPDLFPTYIIARQKEFEDPTKNQKTCWLELEDRSQRGIGTFHSTTGDLN